MTPGQKLSQGLTQVLLFPLEYLNMSQDEGGDYSHAGTLAIDFLGWGASGRVYKCPYYAPCDLTCVRTSNNTNRIWQSDGRVLLADGTLDYVTILVEHDNNPPPVGTKVRQGDLLGHTGTAGNVTGDHLHLNVAKGKYAGMEQVPPNGNWQLKNSIHVYDAMYTNNTIIINGYGHNWRVYDGPVGTKEKRKFKWVIYSRKLRSKRNL